MVVLQLDISIAIINPCDLLLPALGPNKTSLGLCPSHLSYELAIDSGREGLISLAIFLL